jgi:hypothetical protein
LAGREAMVFDTVSEIRSLDDDKLMTLMAPPPRG